MVPCFALFFAIQDSEEAEEPIKSASQSDYRAIIEGAEKHAAPREVLGLTAEDEVRQLSPGAYETPETDSEAARGVPFPLWASTRSFSPEEAHFLESASEGDNKLSDEELRELLLDDSLEMAKLSIFA